MPVFSNGHCGFKLLRPRKLVSSLKKDSYRKIGSVSKKKFNFGNGTCCVQKECVVKNFQAPKIDFEHTLDSDSKTDYGTHFLQTIPSFI